MAADNRDDDESNSLSDADNSQEGHGLSSDHNSEAADDADDATMEDPDEPLTKTSSSEGEGEEEESSTPSSPKLGGLHGSNGTPAYALLVGVVDPGLAGADDTHEIISVPITRLPTTLGQEHAAKDPSFVGLKEGGHGGTEPTCSIFYRDAWGGRLGLYKNSRKGESCDGKEDDDPLDGMVYKPRDDNNLTGDEDRNEKALTPRSEDNILRPTSMDDKAPLPASGFFAIECTEGEIAVGEKIVSRGQVALLRDGIPIRIASHWFYFLLPKKSSLPPSTYIRVRTGAPAATKAEKLVSHKAAAENPKREGDGKKDEAPSPRAPAKKPRRSEDPPPSSAPFDGLSDAEILAILAQKVSGAAWDHEGQRVGSALATRACRAAAAAPTILAIARAEGGVTQREIVDWMTNGPDSIYREYEAMMLTKIVEKSFLMSMGKAVVRAGYMKNETSSGRAFRWNLPKDIFAPRSERDREREERQVSSPSLPVSQKEHSEEGSNRSLELFYGKKKEGVDDGVTGTNNTPESIELLGNKPEEQLTENIK